MNRLGSLPSVPVIVGARQPLLRLGIGAALRNARSMFVVGEASHEAELIDIVLRTEPAVAVVVADPIAFPAAALRTHLSEAGIRTNLILLQEERVKAGDDWLDLFTAGPAELLAAVQSAAFTRAVDCRLTLDTPLPGPQVHAGWARLSERDQDVLLLACEGYNRRQIGDVLSLSPEAVETHLRHTREVLGANSLLELATWTAGLRLASFATQPPMGLGLT